MIELRIQRELSPDHSALWDQGELRWEQSGGGRWEQ